MEIGQAEIKRLEGCLKIVIPSAKNAFLIMGMLVSPLVTIFGIIFLGGILVYGDIGSAIGILIIFLLLWIAIGALNFVILAWNLAGEETITIDSSELKAEKAVIGLHFRKAFYMRDIDGVRVVPQAAGLLSYYEDYYFINAGRIAFDYGMKTYRFGQGLNEVEAGQLLKMIKESGYLLN
jgi:hypothetical protein